MTTEATFSSYIIKKVYYTMYVEGKSAHFKRERFKDNFLFSVFVLVLFIVTVEEKTYF